MENNTISTIKDKNFEQVSFWTNAELGITAIIAIHNTVLGPSLGGCRVYNYSSLDLALHDALRLSEGMTLKNALAGLPIGGGKSVIMASPSAMKRRREVFLQFGAWVESLGGRYITAEDMGSTVSDIRIVQEVSSYVSGTDPSQGGGGDPSPFTARGVYLGMKSCAERVFSSPSLSGLAIHVQGVGAVGKYLCEHLKEEGADILVSDVSSEKLKEAEIEYGAKVIPLEDVYTNSCDIFSPCAIGGILNASSVKTLNCKIIAGAANNQLASPEDEQVLQERNILYAPDFAINAGGVIMCADEVGEGGFQRSRVDERVKRIGVTVAQILDEAASKGTLAGQIAIDRAYEEVRAKSIQL